MEITSPWLAQEQARDAEHCQQRRKYPPMRKGCPRLAVARDAAEIFGFPQNNNKPATAKASATTTK